MVLADAEIAEYLKLGHEMDVEKFLMTKSFFRTIHHPDECVNRSLTGSISVSKSKMSARNDTPFFVKHQLK